MTTRKTRLISMILDHFIMCWILIPPLLLVNFCLVSPNTNPLELDWTDQVGFWIMIFLYLNKDFLFGKSIAKRIIGLQVIDNRNNQPADEFKCFLRNMTIPLYPLEVLVTLFTPDRRIGDWIANTRVEPFNKSLGENWMKEFKQKRITKRTGWMVISGICYLLLLGHAMNNWLNYMDSLYLKQ